MWNNAWYEMNLLHLNYHSFSPTIQNIVLWSFKINDPLVTNYANVSIVRCFDTTACLSDLVNGLLQFHWRPGRRNHWRCGEHSAAVHPWTPRKWTWGCYPSNRHVRSRTPPCRQLRTRKSTRVFPHTCTNNCTGTRSANTWIPHTWWRICTQAWTHIYTWTHISSRTHTPTRIWAQTRNHNSARLWRTPR